MSGWTASQSPEYRENLVAGEEFQDYITQKFYDAGISFSSYSSRKYQRLYGENSARIEIKLDRLSEQSGCVYIEVAEKAVPEQPQFSLGGIYSDSNPILFVVGNYKLAYVFFAKQLRYVHKNKDVKHIETPTSKGFILDQEQCERFSIFKIHGDIQEFDIN